MSEVTNADLVAELRSFKKWLETPLEQVIEPKKKAKKQNSKRKTKKNKKQEDSMSGTESDTESVSSGEEDKDKKPKAKPKKDKKRPKEKKTDEQEKQEVFVHERGKKQKQTVVVKPPVDVPKDAAKDVVAAKVEAVAVQAPAATGRGGPRF